MRWLCALTLAATLVACSDRDLPEPLLVPVPTQPPAPDGLTVCMDAVLPGTLVADPRWGVAVAPGGGGRVQKVVWPNGYIARRLDDLVELLDANGRVVGRIGDHVELGGGFGVDDSEWFTCGLSPG